MKRRTSAADARRALEAPVGGLQRTLFGHRWQAFSRDSAGETPSMSLRTVKFKDLDAALPQGVRRIDSAGRRDQITRREAGFKRRFIDS